MSNVTLASALRSWRCATFGEAPPSRSSAVCVPESMEAGALDLQGIEQRPELILDDLLRSVCAPIAVAVKQPQGVRFPRFQILAEEPFQRVRNRQAVFACRILHRLDLATPRALCDV